MKHRNHIGRWIAAGATALALSGAGVASASAPPTAPADPSAPTDMAGAGSTPGTGAGPSTCAPVPAAAEPPAGSEAPAASAAPAGSEAPAATEAAAATMPVDVSTPGASAPVGSLPAGGPFVQVEETEEYGPILVDAQCRTLYAFTNDTPGTPTCTEACAEAWPVLTVPSDVVPPLADELDPTLFSVVEHPEAGPMLQVGDWPLYYFASDAAPGDLNGQGVGGVWWLVAPDGTLLAETTASSAPAGTDGGATAGTMPMGSEPA